MPGLFVVESPNPGRSGRYTIDIPLNQAYQASLHYVGAICGITARRIAATT
jgi:hypothetical protein